MRISGSRALVTGGASGIGRAIAQTLAVRGCRVLVADIDGGRAGAIAAELGPETVGVQCDVSDHAAVERLADDADRLLGGFDLVFANAGVSVGGPLLDADPAELDWIFGVNVRGIWSTASVFGRRLRSSGRPGHLCLTASEHALGLQHAGMGLYTATKHAVLGLADVLRAELPPSIGVSILCPGLVSTELHLSKRHGPLPPDDDARLAMAGAVMARGMSAEIIGQAAVNGVERGDFLIVTHPSSAQAAQKRGEEIAAAFKAQAPWSADAERYSVNSVIATVMQDAAGQPRHGDKIS